MVSVLEKLRRDGFVELLRSVKVNVFWWLECQVLWHFPKLLLIAFRKPRFVNLELTNVCNLRCKMCLRGGGRKEGFMSFGVFKSLVDELARIGGVSLSFHWAGEATLHPQFFEFMEYVIVRKRFFYKLHLTTNGTNFTDDVALVCLGLDSVTFSLDGVGRVNDDIRVGCSYDEVRKNILDFVRMRGKCLSPVISTNTVVNYQKDEELVEMCEAWKNSGVVTSFNGCLGENFELLDRKRAKVWCPRWLSIYSSPRCFMPFSFLMVSWDGFVNVCCHNLKNVFPVGCVADGIMNIWKSKELDLIRKGIIMGKPYFYSVCVRCKKFEW